MNMIVCDKGCRHQKDGYCSLQEITNLTGQAEPCGYYDPVREEEAPSAEQGKSL